MPLTLPRGQGTPLLQRAALHAARRRGWNPPLRVRAGVGRGLRVGPRNASAEYWDGTNELPVQLALRQLLRPGDVFYDVGANVGFFSLLAARLVGPGHVYAFEALAENARCLRANVRLNRLDNITVVAAAVGSTSGAATLKVTRHPGGATIADHERPTDVVADRIVPLVAIDHLMTAGDVRPPSLVKIDVEGAELEVLRGMAGTLRQHGPALLCELDAARPQGLETKVRRVRDWLSSNGYGAVSLPDSYPHVGWHVRHLLAAPNPDPRSPS